MTEIPLAKSSEITPKMKPWTFCSNHIHAQLLLQLKRTSILRMDIGLHIIQLCGDMFQQKSVKSAKEIDPALVLWGDLQLFQHEKLGIRVKLKKSGQMSVVVNQQDLPSWGKEAVADSGVPFAIGHGTVSTHIFVENGEKGRGQGRKIVLV